MKNDARETSVCLNEMRDFEIFFLQKWGVEKQI